MVLSTSGTLVRRFREAIFNYTEDGVRENDGKGKQTSAPLRSQIRLLSNEKENIDDITINYTMLN